MSDRVRISYHGMNPNPAIDAAIHERSEKLFQLFDRISSCRVVVEAPHKSHHKGNLYGVHLELHVPGTVLVVSKDRQGDDAHEDVMVAIRDTFQVAVRKLRHYVERLHDVGDRRASP